MYNNHSLSIHQYQSPCQKCQPSASHRVFIGELIEGLADRRNEVKRDQDRQQDNSGENSHHHQRVITQPDQPTVFCIRFVSHTFSPSRMKSDRNNLNAYRNVQGVLPMNCFSTQHLLISLNRRFDNGMPGILISNKNIPPCSHFP